MFINRIFTRIHKLKNTFTINNNVIFNNGQQKFSTKPIIIRNNVYYTSKRNISKSGWKKPTIEKFKLTDNIPQNYELVYRCTMSSYLYAAQISASIGIVVVFGIAIVNYFNEYKEYFINAPDIELLNILDTRVQTIVFTAGFILINIIIMVFISKFPVRIYSDPKTNQFIGVMFGVVPSMKHLVRFNAGDVIYTPKNGLLPWSEYRYKLKSGKPLVMLDHYFRKPNDINTMLGYTKL